MQKYQNLFSSKDTILADGEQSINTLPDSFKVYSSSAKVQELKEKVISIYSSIQKMGTAIKTLLTSYFSLVRQTQMYTIDLMICEFLIGAISGQNIIDFIENTATDYTEFYDFTKEKAADTINKFSALIQIAKAHTEKLQASHIQRSPIPLSLNFDEILNQIIAKQKANVEKRQDNIKIFPNFDIVSQKIFDFPIMESYSKDQIRKFREWMLSDLSLTDPSSDAYIEVSRAAQRIAMLKQLQEKITITRSLIQNAKTDDPSLYNPVYIVDSPFFKSLATRSTFLRQALTFQEREVTCVPDFDGLIENCGRAFQKYHDECRSIINDVKQQINNLNAYLEQRTGDSAKVRADISPVILSFIRELQFLTPLPQKTNVSALTSQILTTCRPSDPALQNDFKAFEEKVTSKFFKEVIDVDISFSFITKLLTTVAQDDLNIVEITARTSDIEILQMLNAQEMDALANFEKNMRSVLENVKITIDTSNIFKSMEEICEMMMNARQRYDEAEAKFQTQKSTKSVESVEKLTEEVSQLKEEYARLSKNAARVSARLCQSEEYMSVSGERSDVTQRSFTNPAQSTMIAKYSNRVMCPICRKKRRNSILSCCGHCFCRECLNGLKTCPTCNAPFADNNIRHIQL